MGISKQRDSFGRYDYYSYFSNIIYDVEEQKYLVGIANFPPIVPQSEDLFYTIQEEDFSRPDLLSKKFYGTIYLDWVIMLANNIKDPFNGFKIGDRIVVPSEKYIKEVYLNEIETLITQIK